MKRSLATSAVFHILVLIGAMVTLSAPAPLETPESTAMDVDIVQADQLQQGEKKAPVTDHVSRKPTTKQDQVANAQNAGENKVDIKSPVVPTQRPESETAALAPKKVDVPVPQNDPRPNDVKTIEQKDTEAAPKEVAAIPQQKPEVTPAPTPKTDPAPATPKADAAPTPPPTEQQAEIPVPNNVPVPDVKPQPTPQKTVEQKPEVKPAPKPDVKVADAKPTDKTTTQSTSKNTSADDGKKDADKKRQTAKASNKGLDDGLADEIADVLNNTSSKGGAARSSKPASAGADTQVASRGGMKSLGAGKLSQSQQDGLRDLIQKYWNLPPGLEGASDVRIKVHFKLDKSGQIVGEPEATTNGGPASTQGAMQSAAVRAVLRAQSEFMTILPADKYDDWQEVVVNFSAADLGM
ncbi:hypothetical protein A6U86_19700 [Rhizobium sp. AC27/96]|uniref:hypothetical protein n=1 Tax=Rhizobium TaxID=379 RepID=UPI00082910C3|nr:MULTISPECIES: hypothetical protein [Rhizobium]NTF43112.1 hypothetical protein [Rhizobium rhizogenes]OCI93257.1 hypothetical protein A6U86_19700 [Rhizobium sp. AC27/96]